MEGKDGDRRGDAELSNQLEGEKVRAPFIRSGLPWNTWKNREVIDPSRHQRPERLYPTRRLFSLLWTSDQVSGAAEHSPIWRFSKVWTHPSVAVPAAFKLTTEIWRAPLPFAHVTAPTWIHFHISHSSISHFKKFRSSHLPIPRVELSGTETRLRSSPSHPVSKSQTSETFHSIQTAAGTHVVRR